MHSLLLAGIRRVRTRQGRCPEKKTPFFNQYPLNQVDAVHCFRYSIAREARKTARTSHPTVPRWTSRRSGTPQPIGSSGACAQTVARSSPSYSRHSEAGARASEPSWQRCIQSAQTCCEIRAGKGPGYFSFRDPFKPCSLDRRAQEQLPQGRDAEPLYLACQTLECSRAENWGSLPGALSSPRLENAHRSQARAQLCFDKRSAPSLARRRAKAEAHRSSGSVFVGVFVQRLENSFRRESRTSTIGLVRRLGRGVAFGNSSASQHMVAYAWLEG